MAGMSRTRLILEAAQSADLARSLAVLSRTDVPPVSDHIVTMLMKNAKADEDVLWNKVRDRSRIRSIGAEERLRARAKAEANEMGRILLAQKAAIEKEMGRRTKAERDAKEMKQVVMPWLPEEKDQKEQYDADTKYIERRLADLEKELATEPDRIRSIYEVQHYRLERVGLVYLWPTTS